MVTCPLTCPPVYVARILLNTRLVERRVYDAGCLKVYTNKQGIMGVLFIIRNAAIARKHEQMKSNRQKNTSKINKVKARVTHLRKERAEQSASPFG